MSMRNYFAPSKTTVGEVAAAVAVAANTIGFTRHELDTVTADLHNVAESGGKKTRASYSEDTKIKIAEYSANNGVASAVSKFNGEFPKLYRSTVYGWMDKYKAEL